MRQNENTSNTVHDIARYFGNETLPSEKATLGQVIVEILHAGKSLNRKAICSALIRRLSQSASPLEEQHYQKLISMLFDR
ncbi:regulatory protein YcgZ [Pantoea stewartii]|uniref:regulatory protein YcgZ n=1 Tax=Pantoea stewartii TaxID=66269 RepID=UPI0013903A68|nr:regulatory protein YcgZ [Pantoea stewartii]